MSKTVESVTVNQLLERLRRNIKPEEGKLENRVFYVDGVRLSALHARRDFFPDGLGRIDTVRERLKEVQLALPLLYFPESKETRQSLKDAYSKLGKPLSQNAMYRLFQSFPDLEPLSELSKREWSYATNKLFKELYEARNENIKMSERYELINTWLGAISTMISTLVKHKEDAIQNHRKLKGTDRVLSKKIAAKKKRSKKRSSPSTKQTADNSAKVGRHWTDACRASANSAKVIATRSAKRRR